jgi:hypothetical protein
LHLEIIRKWLTDKSSIGELFIDSARECFTLEDRLRPDGPKVSGYTAIPAGTYKLIVDYSHRFSKYMPHILNVPGFDGIRIHSGNTDADTLGCPLLGAEKSLNSVMQSRLAYSSFFGKIAQQTGYDSGQRIVIFKIKEPSDIKITDAPESDLRTV